MAVIALFSVPSIYSIVSVLNQKDQAIQTMGATPVVNLPPAAVPMAVRPRMAVPGPRAAVVGFAPNVATVNFGKTRGMHVRIPAEPRVPVVGLTPVFSPGR